MMWKAPQQFAARILRWAGIGLSLCILAVMSYLSWVGLSKIISDRKAINARWNVTMLGLQLIDYQAVNGSFPGRLQERAFQDYCVSHPIKDVGWPRNPYTRQPVHIIQAGSDWAEGDISYIYMPAGRYPGKVANEDSFYLMMWGDHGIYYSDLNGDHVPDAVTKVYSSEWEVKCGAAGCKYYNVPPVSLPVAIKLQAEGKLPLAQLPSGIK